jgi:glycosyltransferase involved in cell wall biosynthesis
MVTGEGITKPFEYMAVGLPVLFSDFPKLKQFIGSLGAGMAVDPTDPRKIAEALDYLCEHPEVCREMGEAGRKAVRERYHWEYEERTLLDLYRRIVAGPHAAASATPRTNPQP